MASWLATGEGASQGLEEVLHRMILEQAQQQQLAEQTRHNTAAEGLEGRRIDEQSADRRLREQERADTRSDTNRQREEGNVLRRVALRPIGAEVTPEEKTGEVAHGIPIGNYNFTPANMGRETVTGEEVPATPDSLKWKGTQDQITRAATAGKHGEDKGIVHDTPKGLMRLFADGTTEPVLDDQGKPVQGYHAPDRVIVNTAEGLLSRPDVARRLAGGQTVEGPLPAMTRQRMYSSRQVTSHIQDTKDEIDEADRRGLLGPLEGRWAEFLRGTVGSTDLGGGLGSPENDELLNQLRTDLKLMGSGTMMAHFGARGGQNLIEDFNKTVLNSGKMSRSSLRGSLNSIENWLGTYGQNPAAHGQPRTPPPSGGNVIRYDMQGNVIK